MRGAPLLIDDASEAMMPDTKFIPLRAKLIGAIVPLIVLPFGLAGSIMYAQYVTGLEQAAAISAQQIVNQVSGSIQRLVDDAERLTQAPVSDSEMLALLRNHSIDAPRAILSFDETASVTQFLTSAVFDRRSISGYVIFTDDGYMLSAPVSVLIPRIRWTHESNAEWMATAERAAGALVVIPSHEVDYYIGGPRVVVSFVRLLRDRVTHVPIGFAKIDLTESALADYLSSPTVGELGSIVISTAEGEQIYPALTPAVSSDAVTFISNALPLGLVVRADVSSVALRQDSRGAVTFAVAVGALCLVVAAALAAVIIGRLMQPVRHLNTVMGRVRSGDLQTRAEVRTRDEVGSLTVTFNGMMDDLDRLIDQVYRAQISERDALISALQAQVNPHFLYNSLEAVNMLAASEGQWTISEAVSGLGQQLRYLTDIKHSLVPLRRELAFAESWLRLQALRRQQEIVVDDRIDPAFDSVLVPRVSIQPLLENALKHARPSGPLEVTLNARVLTSTVHIEVSDNGQGMSETELRAFRYALEQHESTAGDDGGYGLSNLEERLKLHFGSGAGLHLDRAGDGLTVTIVVPLERQDEATIAEEVVA